LKKYCAAIALTGAVGDSIHGYLFILVFNKNGHLPGQKPVQIIKILDTNTGVERKDRWVKDEVSVCCFQKDIDRLTGQKYKTNQNKQIPLAENCSHPHLADLCHTK
jgi:hypothetical protein